MGAILLSHWQHREEFGDFLAAPHSMQDLGFLDEGSNPGPLPLEAQSLNHLSRQEVQGDIFDCHNSGGWSVPAPRGHHAMPGTAPPAPTPHTAENPAPKANQHCQWLHLGAVPRPQLPGGPLASDPTIHLLKFSWSASKSSLYWFSSTSVSLHLLCPFTLTPVAHGPVSFCTTVNKHTHLIYVYILLHCRHTEKEIK